MSHICVLANIVNGDFLDNIPVEVHLSVDIDQEVYINDYTFPMSRIWIESSWKQVGLLRMLLK